MSRTREPLQVPGGFARRGGASRIGEVSILKPKEYGGVTAYNLNSGDKAWWIPNGGWIKVTSNDPLFAGVTLPPAAPGGQAEIITTRTLVIYGTGRSGGVPDTKPMLFAVDKATGKQVGAVEIPSRTTAVPMTFMHQGSNTSCSRSEPIRLTRWWPSAFPSGEKSFQGPGPWKDCFARGTLR